MNFCYLSLYLNTLQGKNVQRQNMIALLPIHKKHSNFRFFFTKVKHHLHFVVVYIFKFCIYNIVSKIIHVIHRSEIAKNISTANDVQLTSSRRLFNYYIDNKNLSMYIVVAFYSITIEYYFCSYYIISHPTKYH